MRLGMNVFVDVENLAVLADIERPARRKSGGAQYAVRLGDPLIGVTENGVVEPERPGELAVGFDGIDAHAEVFGFEATENAVAGSQRCAFARTVWCESFGEPGEHDGVHAMEIAEAVPAAVGSSQTEVRRCVAGFQFDMRAFDSAGNEIDQAGKNPGCRCSEHANQFHESTA